MKKRLIQPLLHSLSLQYPIVSLTGPRQSGKTTVAKACFPDFSYVSLEDPDHRQWATEDPRGFLASYPQKNHY